MNAVHLYVKLIYTSSVSLWNPHTCSISSCEIHTHCSAIGADYARHLSRPVLQKTDCSECHVPSVARQYTDVPYSQLACCFHIVWLCKSRVLFPGRRTRNLPVRCVCRLCHGHNAPFHWRPWQTHMGVHAARCSMARRLIHIMDIPLHKAVTWYHTEWIANHTHRTLSGIFSQKYEDFYHLVNLRSSFLALCLATSQWGLWLSLLTLTLCGPLWLLYVSRNTARPRK